MFSGPVIDGLSLARIGQDVWLLDFSLRNNRECMPCRPLGRQSACSVPRQKRQILRMHNTRGNTQTYNQTETRILLYCQTSQCAPNNAELWCRLQQKVLLTSTASPNHEGLNNVCQMVLLLPWWNVGIKKNDPHIWASLRGLAGSRGAKVRIKFRSCKLWSEKYCFLRVGSEILGLSWWFSEIFY